MSVLSIENVVNVNVSRVPAGLETPNVNRVAIITDTKPKSSSTFNSFRIYLSPNEIGNDFETSSDIYAMGQALFSQTPNPISTQGSLAVFAFEGDFSKSTFKTADISANISHFAAVTDGALKLTYKGKSEVVDGIDVSGVTTMEEIAAILNEDLPDFWSCAVNDVGNGLVITSPFGGAGAVFSIEAASTGTDLTAANLLNVAAGSYVSGTGETVADAVIRCSGLSQFVGFMTTRDVSALDLMDTAAVVQPIDKIWLVAMSGDFSIASSSSLEIANSQFSHVRCLYYGNSASVKNFGAAYMGRAFSVNFLGTSTVQDMNLKLLTGIAPDLSVTEEMLLNAKNSGLDLYVSFGGISRVFSSGKNQWFDQVYNSMALKLELQTQLFNSLATTMTKIPQTESGMDVLKSVIAHVFQRFTRNGYIAAGQWNSANTFGDPVTFKRNISESGYYIYSLPISQQPQNEREKRIAPLIQAAVKESGSINSVILNVFIEA